MIPRLCPCTGRGAIFKLNLGAAGVGSPVKHLQGSQQFLNNATATKLEVFGISGFTAIPILRFGSCGKSKKHSVGFPTPPDPSSM